MLTITADALRAELAQFTGTEDYHRHNLNPRVTFTDGVAHFAEQAGAFWLLDILATELPKLVREHRLVFVAAHRDEGERGCRLICRRDTGEPALWQRDIPLTDLPVGTWPLWMSEGGPEGTHVIMLPSEY